MTITLRLLFFLSSALPMALSCSPIYPSLPRLPPYLGPPSSPSTNASSSTPWPAPPPEHYAGTWHITNASLASYRRLRNLQWDVIPAAPSCVANTTDACPPHSLAGQFAEITTWDLPGNSNTTTGGYPNDLGALCPVTANTSSGSGSGGGGNAPCASFLGHHTPRHLSQQPPTASSSSWDDPKWAGVFDVAGTSGIMDGFRNQWAVLWWGEDARGTPFMLIHEDASTQNGQPSQGQVVDAVSRSPAGPDPESLGLVLGLLEGMWEEWPGWGEMVRGVGPVEYDDYFDGDGDGEGEGRRRARGMAICPESCWTNGESGGT